VVADLLAIVRTIHLLAGVSWLGEVITINAVLLPVLFAAKREERLILLSAVFPRVFRLATVLGGLAVGTGLVLFLWSTRLQPLAAVRSRWGELILAGGVLGAALFAFHLFQESGAEQSIAAHLAFALDSDDPRETRRLLRRLAFFPRAGMLVLIAVIGMMTAAAHFL